MTLLDFVNKVYNGYDASHDTNHALSVMSNALKIYNAERVQKKLVNEESSKRELYEIIFTSLLHDGQDHKYVGTGVGIDRSEFENYFIEQLGPVSAKKCLHICDNISWSKEVKGLNKPLPESEDWMRRLIQDADWLEAIGQTGLNRCFDYARTHDCRIPEDVCIHIKEKLLIISENLHTETAKSMASGLNKPLMDYLAEHDN